jgi:glycosyltransferase involved in cell wall biosynthesis
MGTKSHASDLNMIAPAMKTVAERMPDLQIVQIGGGSLLPHAREIKVPGEAKEYPAFVMWFRAVCIHATIAIAPLREDPFNAAKSDIKTLDYGLARIPAIYSEVGPYATAVSHEQTGLLCKNTSRSWSEAIISLLENESLREKIREAAFERARGRGLNTLATQWRDVLIQVFDHAK